MRAIATSASGIALGTHLARLGLSGPAFGLVLSAGLAGTAGWAIAATLWADRVGRKRFLIAVAALGAVGTALFALQTDPTFLALCAAAGAINAMGRDRGGAPIVEQAALPATTDDAGRTRVVATYTMFQDVGHAVGALVVAIPAWRGAAAGASQGPATFGAAAAALAVCAALYLGLSRSIDAGAARARVALSPRSRTILVRICALFAVDALAGGFLTTAMLSWFFFARFGVDEGTIGVLFFGARLLNAVSHLGAAWLAGRIGLVPTMVFTHIPSSVFLASVAIAPNFAVAAALFLLREGLVEMDVPTRQSYVLAVVEPSERTFAMGVTQLVRVCAWAVAPLVAGGLVAGGSLWLPLVVGAAMKIAYDLLLWRAFRGLRAPEERAAAG